MCRSMTFYVSQMTTYVSQMTTYVSRDVSLPAQRTTSLVVSYARLEEILLFTQVHHF